MSRDPLALNFLFQYFIIVCDVLQCTMPDRQTTAINPLLQVLRAWTIFEDISENDCHKITWLPRNAWTTTNTDQHV